MKYVQQSRGKWKVRITVPEELRDIIGGRELVESDLPSDAKSREKLAHGIINRFFARIDEAREVFQLRKNAPTASLSVAAKAHYASAVMADDQKRALLPSSQEIDTEKERALDRLAEEQRSNRQSVASIINATADFSLKAGARHFYRNNRMRRLAALRSSFASGETRWIEPAVDQYIRDNHLELRRDTQEWRDLANALMRAEIEALERTLERDMGDFSGLPKDPLLTVPDPQVLPANGTAVHPQGITLTEAVKAFHEERMAGGSTLAPKTREEHRNAVRMFNEFMGNDVPVNSITKRNVIDYKQALLKTPNRYTLRFPGLTLPQAIKANAKLATPIKSLAPKTINMKWLSHLSSILQWASNNGHMDTNPAQGIRVDTGSKTQHEPSYLPFTKDELQKIFGDPIFVNPKSYGLNQWATLIMLYTGVRNSSEMAGMRLVNIFDEQDVPVFYLADATKNQRSKRLVPIHNDLIRIGFLDYVDSLRKKGETLLFPEWAKRHDKVNDWFNNTFLVNIGLKSKQKVFYSFRHTLATELARAGIPRELSKMISGHAPQEIASVYIQASPITLMSEALNKVNFDLPIVGLKAIDTRNS